MAETINVITICGSLRKGSYNAALARQLPGLAPSGMSIKAAPAWDKIPIYNFDIQNSSGFPADVEAWADAIRAADGVIIVSPEYNWSIPGGLKNAIDWVSRPLADNPLTGKPAAVVGASTGLFGAVWAQAELRKVLGAVGARVVDRELPIGQADEALGADGLPRDRDAVEALAATLDDLRELAGVTRVTA